MTPLQAILACLAAGILTYLALCAGGRLHEYLYWKKHAKDICFEVEQELRKLDELTGDTREHDYHAESFKALEQLNKELKGDKS